MRRTSIVLSLTAMLLFGARSQAQVTVLNGATIIDGTSSGAQKDATIVLENGHIREVALASKISNPQGALVVDLTGKFVVPGIINAHGHVGAKTEPQYALYGVTTATSMQPDPNEVVEVREAQKRGELRGARVSTVKYRQIAGCASRSAPTAEAPLTASSSKVIQSIARWN